MIVSVGGVACRRRNILRNAIGGGFILFIGLIQAQAATTVNLNAARSMDYDSNLFRLPAEIDPVLVLGSSRKYDFIDKTDIGIGADIDYGRQHMGMKGDVDQVAYHHYDQLNYSGGNFDGQWNGMLGPQVKGELGYNYSKTLTSFQDVQAVLKDILAGNRGHAAIVLFPNKGWQTYLGIDTYDLTHSIDARNYLNNQGTSLTVRTLYMDRAGNSAGLEAARSKLEFPNRAIFEPFLIDNLYHDVYAGPFVDWHFGGASHLNLRGQYTRREYGTVHALDFSGLTGKAAYEWAPTVKTNIGITLWRELTSSDNTIERYIVSRGVSLAPTWAITDKLSFQPLVSREKQEYKGDLIVAGGPGRVDDVTRAGAYLNFQGRYITARLYYEKDARSSNGPLRDFKSDMAGFSLGISGTHH